MQFDVWNANIDPRQVLNTAIASMRKYFAQGTERELLRVDIDETSGRISSEQAGIERARVLSQAADTEKTLENNVLPRLKTWLTDEDARRICPAALGAIADAIDDKRWDHLFEAFFSDIKFGTGGIRGRAVMSVGDLRTMAAYGIDAAFLRGPNLFCDLTVLVLSSAVAKYASENNLKAVVVGFDSRVGGPKFAELIARLFLTNGLKVYLFSKPCPFPELSYSVVHFGADLGIFISASHNDKRYNGYKLTSGTGAQLTNTERENIFKNYVKKATFKDVPDMPEIEELAGNLVIVGEDGCEVPEGASSFNLDPEYLAHLKGLVVSREELVQRASNLNIGYCAYYGAGSMLVPRLLKSAGFEKISEVTYRSMDKPDGFFPCFSYTQQPDPGDPSSAKIAVDSFIAEHGEAAFDDIDILIGTDPDADRMGVVVKVPQNQRDIYGGEWTLLKADQVWALLLWYRLKVLSETEEGRERISKGFIAQSHVTSDLIIDVAASHKLACLQTWVGFSLLAEAVSFAWNEEDIFDSDDYMHKYFTTIYGEKNYVPGKSTWNLGCFEESNGFSILGGAPPADNPKALGIGGHVRDKDGTLAALLIAEIAAYAKSIGKTIVELIDEISLEEGIGLYVNMYRPDPPVGQYEGVNAIATKLFHLHKAEELRAKAQRGEIYVAGIPVRGAQLCPGKGKYAADPDHGYKPHPTMGDVISRSGKMLPNPMDRGEVEKFIEEMTRLGMPAIPKAVPISERLIMAREFFFANVAVFPEEGIRFFLTLDKKSHVTVRPSGTSRNLKIYVQLCEKPQNIEELLSIKKEMLARAERVLVDFAHLLEMKW